MAKSEQIIFPDLEGISAEAAKRFTASAQEAVKERGQFITALSGGRTSKRVYELLALPPNRDNVAWEKVHLFLSDERFVPMDDPENNFGIIREKLISKIAIPETNLHPFIVQAPSLEEAARKSEGVFRDFFGKGGNMPPRFDFIFLGMGADGHAAGLFPDTAALKAQKPLVTFSEKTGGFNRLSLTLPVLNAARQIVFLVAGEEKAEMVARVLGGKAKGFPAAAVNPQEGGLLWLLDHAAASRLSA